MSLSGLFSDLGAGMIFLSKFGAKNWSIISTVLEPDINKALLGGTVGKKQCWTPETTKQAIVAWGGGWHCTLGDTVPVRYSSWHWVGPSLWSQTGVSLPDHHRPCYPHTSTIALAVWNYCFQVCQFEGCKEDCTKLKYPSSERVKSPAVRYWAHE